MVALASTMIVAVLSSRISFSSGVGSWLSSSMRTDRVSLEMRNCRRSCSRFNKPAGSARTHATERKRDYLLKKKRKKKVKLLLLQWKLQSCRLIHWGLLDIIKVKFTQDAKQDQPVYCTTKPNATVCFCAIRSQRDHKRHLHGGRAHASPLITITLELICDSLALPSPRQ